MARAPHHRRQRPPPQSEPIDNTVVTASQLRIEYHPASDGEGAKTPDDFVTVDLTSRKLVHFSA
jgi:hypothetical protein